MQYLEQNKFIYNRLWQNYQLPNPNIWPHWKIIKQYNFKTALEIGPGSKPRIPVNGNYFVDVSREAVMKLRNLGGKAEISDLTTAFLFPASFFDLICAFEVLEHLPNDKFVLKEIYRLLKMSGICLISVPINMKYWSGYDKAVGHIRRYDINTIEDFFSSCGFTITKYSGINIFWPTGMLGSLTAFLIKNYPALVSKLNEWIDMFPNSAVRQPIKLKKWDKEAVSKLETTTCFFVLRKN